MSGRLEKWLQPHFPISFMNMISFLSLGTNSCFSFLSSLCVFLALSTMEEESEEEDVEDDSYAYLLCVII